MKNLLKIVFVVLLFVSASAVTNAQTLKFGHIDLSELIPIMPESAAAQAELERFQSDLEDIFEESYKEYQQKLAEYEQLDADVSEVRRNAKEDEVRELWTRVTNFSNNAEQQIQQKQGELLQPILSKAEATIEEVAIAQGLIYVFDSNSLLYKSNTSVDLLPLVKEKLGIK